MSKPKIVLNSSAVRNLLKSQEVEDACLDQVRRVQAMCGPGYEVDTYVGRNRVNASIRPATPAAQKDNAENKTISKVLEALK